MCTAQHTAGQAGASAQVTRTSSLQRASAFPTLPRHLSGKRRVAALQLFSQPPISEDRAQRQQTFLSPGWPSGGFLDRVEGSWEAKLLWEHSWSSLERQSSMTSHDLLLFISAVQKKQCLTLQTNHTDFGYEVSCSFAQFREEFLYTSKRWQAALCWESCRRAALVPYLQLCLLWLHPQGRLPGGKSGFPGGRWSVSSQHSQDEALQTLTQAFQSDRRAAVCHSCLSSTAHHSFTIPSGHKTELPNSQVTQHWKQWLFLHPAIQKYSIQDKMVICKIH